MISVPHDPLRVRPVRGLLRMPNRQLPPHPPLTLHQRLCSSALYHRAQIRLREGAINLAEQADSAPHTRHSGHFRSTLAGPAALPARPVDHPTVRSRGPQTPKPRCSVLGLPSAARPRTNVTRLPEVTERSRRFNFCEIPAEGCIAG